MLRARLAIFSSISALALMATGALADTPVTNLGLLKPVGDWKVGTVEAGERSYCAMVNRYDRQVVVAFARSPDGNSSLALDFPEDYFEAGAAYKVFLRPEQASARRLDASASSARSVVVQIGQDAPLFDALSGNGNLDIELPTLDVAFALRRFSKSYDGLVDCASGLAPEMASVPPAPIVTGDDPLSAQVADIAGGAAAAGGRTLLAASSGIRKQAAATTETAADGLRSEIAARQAELEKIEAGREAETEKAVAIYSRKDAEAKTRLAAAEKKRDAVAEKAAAQDTPALRAQLVALQTQVATLKKERDAQVDKLTQELAQQQEKYRTRVAALESERDQLKKDLDESVRTAAVTIKSFEKRLAAAEAGTDEGAKARIASLEKEHERKTRALEQQLQQAAARLDAVARADGGGEALAQLEESSRRQQDLQARLDDLEEQNATLRQALTEKKSDGDNALAVELQATKDKLAAAEASYKAQVVALEKRLAAKTASPALLDQAADRQKELQARLDEMSQQNAALRVALNAQIDRQTPELAEAQDRIAKLEAERAGLQEEVRTAQRAAADSARELGAAQGLIARLQARVKSLLSSGDETAAVETPAVRKILASTSSTVAQIPAQAAVTAAAIAPASGDASASAVASAPVRALLGKGYAAKAPAPQEEEITWSPPPILRDEADTVAAPAPVTQKAVTAEGPSVPAVPVTQVEQEEQPVPVAKAAVAPVPAPVSAPMSPEPPVTATIAPGETAQAEAAPVAPNRAMEFLDTIMTYHRKDTAPALETAKAPVKKETQEKAAEAIRPTLLDDDLVPPPRQELAKTPVPAAKIEAAAGPRIPAAPPVQAETRITRAPVPLDLDRLLSASGLQDVAYADVASEPGETVRQWSAGSLTGMVEQRNDARPFDAAVEAYLDRYRADCPGQLEVSTRPAEDSPAGRIAAIDAACTMQGNSYVSSFVFLQDDARFSAVLHTAVPSDAAKVRAAGSRVARVLGASGGLTVASSPTAAARPPRAIEIQAPAVEPMVSYADPTGLSDFQTAIIE